MAHIDMRETKMAKPKMKPLDDRIIVEQKKAEEVTAGGIVLPTTAQERPTIGKCLAVGPGRLLETGARANLSVNVGDELCYSKYSGTEVDFAGTKYTVIRESDVLAVLD